MVRALLLVLLVACQTPGTKIIYEISNNSEQSCGTTNCADVEIPCDAVVSIRILRPDDPAAPLVTICEPLPKNRNNDLCALSSINLASGPLELPKETLEVQMMIWPKDEVVTETGSLDCAKHNIMFDAVAGFPLSQHPSPAIGGHTYYHPGDEEVRVTLGCTDLDALSSCKDTTSVHVTSTVQSFDNIGLFVTDGIVVSVGEPVSEGAVITLKNSSLFTLAKGLQVSGVQIWEGSFTDFKPQEHACAHVFEDVAASTATVLCTGDNIPVQQGGMIDLPGILLPKPSLDQILGALGLLGFPTNGMTIGIVVDAMGNPVAGQTVNAAGWTVQYLNAARSGVGGTSTSSSGVFVSLDAPFPIPFSTSGSSEYVGGQIKDKVTIVVIET